MTDPGSGHDIRHHFDELLAEIRRGAVEMGSLVLENTRRLNDALLENDLERARRVVAADDEVDARYIALEQRVFEVIARQQPVASDLRFLVAITRLLYEIERSGDLVVNAAKGLLMRDGYEIPQAIHGTMAQTSALVADLFGKSIDVLAELDGSAAQWLDRLDDDIDDLVGELYTMIGRSSDDLGFDVGMELSRVARYLERIADHAVNIGEHVAFIVTGSFPDQSSATTDED
jgi:phosphate transport system protein